MGMFDSVYVPCPGCGSEIEFQSKAGECLLENFTLKTAPPVIVEALNGRERRCDKCGTRVRIRSLVKWEVQASVEKAEPATPAEVKPCESE